MDFIDQYITDAKSILDQIDRSQISRMISIINQTRTKNGRLFILGVGGGAGHAWNVDGYSGDLLHCNWGWGGSSNGYFSINSMNGFTEDQGAIINILPSGLEIPIALFEYEVNNLVVSFNDLSEVPNRIFMSS